MARSIVHLTTFLQGGAGRAIADLACAQHAADHDVLVVTSDTGAPGYANYPHYLDRLHAAGVPLLQQDSLFKRDASLNTQVLARVRELRNPETVDVVHAHAGVPAAIGRSFADGASTRRPAVIQTQHGWGTNKTPEQARHDIAVLNTVDGIVVTSGATRDLLVAAGVRAEQVNLIPCGISAHVPPPPAAAVREVTALRDTGRAIIGCVGSVTENKNQALLVRALACDGARTAHAVFIGEGGDTLIPLARDLGVGDRVHALGYQPAADGWIGLFDLLVVPSRSEGQGLVALEAFRAGVPVVASNIPALRELVADYDTGWLFESDDARALAAAVGRAVSLRREIRDRIVDAAARKFLDGYTLDVMIARHEALYDEVTRRTAA